MNFNNPKLSHFLSFVCVFESKVPRHAFLEATKKKIKFCSWRRLVTESYGRDRGKQNGAIVTIFNLITIFLVFKPRKEVLNLLLSRGCFHRVFSSCRWLWKEGSCDSALISSTYFLLLLSYLSVGVGEEVKQNAWYFIYWRIYKSFDNFRVSLQYMNYYSEANCFLNHWF